MIARGGTLRDCYSAQERCSAPRRGYLPRLPPIIPSSINPASQLEGETQPDENYRDEGAGERKKGGEGVRRACGGGRNARQDGNELQGGGTINLHARLARC